MWDRDLQIYGKQFYIEVETGTQGLDKIEAKINHYERLEGWFHVVFTVQDYKPNEFEPVQKTAITQAENMLDLFAKYERRNKYVVAIHKNLVANPTGKILVSPLEVAFNFETIE